MMTAATEPESFGTETHETKDEIKIPKTNILFTPVTHLSDDEWYDGANETGFIRVTSLRIL